MNVTLTHPIFTDAARPPRAPALAPSRQDPATGWPRRVPVTREEISALFAADLYPHS